MTNSTYRYPPDEFDVAVPGGAPVGVHRAPRSGWSSAWPFLLVALVCAGVAWGGITLLSGGGNEGDSAAEPAASVSANPSASPSQSEGGGENGDGGGEGGDEPSGEPSDAQSGGGDALPGDPALADLTVTIGVYNDGAGPGMAATAQTNLQAEGFAGEIHPLDANAAPEGPGTGTVTANTVLYGGDRADTASAVAQALGISGANVQSSEAVAAHPTEGVWVILVQPPG